jgi:hypothetical protein
MMKAQRDRLEAIVGKWLGDLADEAQARAGVSVRDLLMMSVGRVVIAEVQASGDMVSDGDIIHQYERDTIHIRDWLVGAVIRQDAWLGRVNQDGVPLKLAKSGRFSQIVDEANKAMRKLNSRGVATSADSEVVHEFANGYTIVRLDTSAELEAESSMMQHCVGQGAYHGAVEAGAIGILSLRDPANKAHVTIEIDLGSGRVVQVKGKQNDIPRSDYFALVPEWLNTQDFEFNCDDHPVGYAVDRAGKLVNIADLSAGSVFDGDLKVDLRDNGPLPALPDNLTVRGSFRAYAERGKRLSLPKGLSVGGDLMLNGFDIDADELPGAAIYLEQCSIRKLPRRVLQTTTIKHSAFTKEFEQGGRVFFERLACLSDCEASETAFGRMRFLHNLNIDNAKVTLRAGIETAGDLHVTRSNIWIEGTVIVGGNLVFNQSTVRWGSTADKNKLAVAKSFHAHRSTMHALPDHMSVGGELRLSTIEGLTVLPGTAVVGGRISIDDTMIKSLDGRREFNGGLHLLRTNVEELEAGTFVKGSLKISNGPLSRLPHALVVEGDLLVSGSPLKRIPNDARIGGDIVLKGSFVVAIPEGFNVRGNLDISGVGSFLIPRRVTIDGALLAAGSGLEQLPSDLSVRSIIAPSSRLARLPRGLNIEGDLDVRGTGVRSVPDGMVVGGYADFRKTAIQLVPASVFVGGELRVEDHVTIDIPVFEQRGSYPRFG